MDFLRIRTHALALALLVVTFAPGCGRWSTHQSAHLGAFPTAGFTAIPGGVGVAAGTPVNVVLTCGIRSGDDSADEASFALLHDVRGIDGQVALPAGSPVLVRIREHRSRRLGRPGEVVVETVGVLAPGGVMVPLEGRVRVKGEPRRRLAAGMTIGMTFLYWPFSVFHLLHRGREAQLQSGFVIRANIAA